MFKLKRIADNKEYALSEASLLVGRSQSCDICVTEGHPSREHARIMQKDETVLVQDLHSTNGTFVNNQRIGSSAKLEIGDVVKFGDEAFSIQPQSQPDTTVLVKSLGQDDNMSALVVEDDDNEEEEDSTDLLHLYALPRGWSEDGANFISDIGKLDTPKQRAINRYIEKIKDNLKGSKGILLILFSDDNPPVIKTLVLKDGRSMWTFGRGEDCDLVFENPCISMHHAIVTYGSEGWIVEDSNSTNGMLLKGRKQKTIELEDNMTIKIGLVEVLVRFIA